ncbi:MAG: hypothetical protein LQ350_006349 [Teloschistes chrysophthalmus]|nr:MAG: hypothetical protein LQ350_006349 [Niorma chrysophthalma]
MGKIKKKGTSGQAKNFITRTQAVRKLQISLPDFRRLCIYKGIYPREPRNKKKASKTSTPSTTFYYTKDIQYLLHEPILNKFRDHKALAKKIARSLGRGEVGDAARLEKNGKPRITLDHIIRARYPTFVDALRDLDDALSLLFLFVSLPSTSTVPPKTIALCQRLTLEFQHVLIVKHALRKSFISIKGIYYQATIEGQDILWLVPHKFVQRVSDDVDYRIMGTFVEFYTTLLGFVNYRLYTSQGLVYPPRFDVKSDEQGGELGAFTLQDNRFGDSTAIEGPTDQSNPPAQDDRTPLDDAAVQKIVEGIAQNPQPNEDQGRGDAMPEEGVSDGLDKFEVQGEGADILEQPSMSDTDTASLFTPYSFFLSRETPRQPLEFLLRAFGCKRIGWDEVLGHGAFTNDMADRSITHQIVDRPMTLHPSVPGEDGQIMPDAEPAPMQGGRMPGRTYVQPQWVWDCINQGKLLRPDLYAPGATLPPHLSPWVKPPKTGMVSTAPLDEQEEDELVGSEEEEEDEVGEEEEADSELADVGLTATDLDGEEGHGMDVAVADSDSDSDSDSDDFAGFASDDNDLETPTTTTNRNSNKNLSPAAAKTNPHKSHRQLDLEAEAAGLPYNPSPTSVNPSSSASSKGTEEKREKREAEDELAMRKMMMSKRKRKLYEKMIFSNQRKEEAEGRVEGKRRRLLGEST